MTTTSTVNGMDVSQLQAKWQQTKTSDKADVKTTEETNTTGSAIKGLGDNFASFLTLLTTQLKNQDPTKPMDTNEMTAQLVQFANVEQNIGTNSRLDKLVSMQQSALASSNLGYLNKTVSYEGSSFTLDANTTDTPLSYSLDSKAKSVEVKILDSSGKTVRTFKGETSAGKHQLNWDYKDSSGNAVPAGTYKITASATAEKENEVISPKTYTFGRVVGVGSKDGETTLMVDGKELKLSSIDSVH
ncbi:MAG TPA: flagellar hook capping FlgD N-terminal domain-containing protein [Azospirillum sp.]|nr:flagellar hook capping FlgD N-terminal domain-containing protein [Azospirillum sp.]